MAKVLFINPLMREEDEPRHVPYGIALLAAIAMRDGHQVQVYDHNAWRPSDAVVAQVLQADRLGRGRRSAASPRPTARSSTSLPWPRSWRPRRSWWRAAAS